MPSEWANELAPDDLLTFWGIVHLIWCLLWFPVYYVLRALLISVAFVMWGPRAVRDLRSAT